MNAKDCKEMATMWTAGYRPYTGEVDGSVYERLGCPGRARPYWMCRWPILVCLGCGRRCTPRTPRGFTGMLPIDLPKQPAPRPFALSPRELARSKELLRVDEVVYCLGVSDKTAYRLADQGVLVKHRRTPWRVTSASVLAEMDNVDL